MANNTLEIVIKGTDKSGGMFQAANRNLGGLHTALKGIAQTALGFLSARLFENLASSAIGFAKSVVTEAFAAQEATTQLNAVLASTQGVAGVTAKTATDLADSLSRVTRFEDEAILGAENLLLTFTKIDKDIFPSATETVLNMSQALGQDLKSSATQLGKALQDPILGVTALSRVGVNFTESQKAMIESMVEAGDIAGAQKLILRELEVQFGNSARAAGESLPGQLDILRNAFGNVKETIGAAFIPAIQNVTDLLKTLMPVISDTVLPAFQSLGGWVADISREWTRGFAELIVRATSWGANIVESLAGGIMGSDAITRALRSVANSITMWLMPGSPPKLLPDLTKWGQGAVDAWLDGWTVSASKASGFLRNLRGNLKPFLEQIDLGETVDASRLRDVFGGDAPEVERYLTAYRDVGVAVEQVAKAKEALAKAEEGGNEAAIATAREQFGTAQKEEYDAKRKFYLEERRLEKRVSAEVQLARAVVERSKVETRAAQNAAQLSAEAEQRAIEQAYLQYRLAVAGTPEGQIGIWEEELAKVAEGTAQFWQIKTRIVELERAAQTAGGGIATALGEGLGAGLEGEVEKRFNDSGAYMEQSVTRIDWGGIGKAIAGAVWDGVRDWAKTKIDEVTQQWADQIASEENLRKAAETGARWGREMVHNLAGELANPSDGRDRFDVTLPDQAMQSANPLIEAAKTLGGAFADGFVEAFKARWTASGGFWGILGVDDWLGNIKRQLVNVAEDAANVVTGGRPVSRFASGTGFYPGGWGLVGEEGPEMVRLPRGSEILPAGMTERAMGGTVNHVAITINAPGGDPRQVEIGVLRGLRAAGVMP